MDMRVDSDTLVHVLSMIEVECRNLDTDPRIVHELFIGFWWAILKKPLAYQLHVLCFFLVIVRLSD